MAELIQTALMIIGSLGGLELVKFIFSKRKRNAEATQKEHEADGTAIEGFIKLDAKRDVIEAQLREESARKSKEKEALYVRIQELEEGRLKLMECKSKITIENNMLIHRQCTVYCPDRVPDSAVYKVIKPNKDIKK